MADEMKNCLPDPHREERRVTLLLSGGIDSAACLAFYHAQKVHVTALHFDYGQRARIQEFEAAKRLASHFNVRLAYRKILNARLKDSGEIVGRNAFLLIGALLEMDLVPGVVAIGVHAGSPYFDCGEEFVGSVQRLFDAYTSGRVKVGAPFLNWTKPEIWHFCFQTGVPLHLAYSCERGGEKPCGMCLSCLDVETLYARENR